MLLFWLEKSLKDDVSFIVDENSFQLGKQECGGLVLLAALWQTEQYLFLTLKYRIFPVSLSIMMPTQHLALYDCLWERLFQPPSTITVITGTPWWYLLLEITMAFSAALASFSKSSRRAHHHRPIHFSMDMKDFFVKEGMPSIPIDSVSGACPPPVAICPHTAARLHSQ